MIVTIDRKAYKAHRLVASTFIPNPENKPCINHKNGIRNHNRVSNIECCTYQENSKHAVDTELCGYLKEANII